MLVKHALRITGRAAGVAEHRRFALVALIPMIIAAFGRQQSVEFLLKHNEMLNRTQPWFQPLDKRRERRIVKQHAILGMVGDVDDLIVEQARVNGVHHSTHADRAKPGNQVANMVGTERRHPIPRFYTHPIELLREPPRIADDARPCAAGDAAIGLIADDLAGAMLTGCMIEEPRKAKGPILHSAEHFFSCLSAFCGTRQPAVPSLDRSSRCCGRLSRDSALASPSIYQIRWPPRIS